MHIEEQAVGSVHVLSVVHARLDQRSAGELKGSVASLVERQNCVIVLDLSKVSFVDSSGLGAIVGSLKLVGRDGELAVCGMNESVATLFKLTRMDKVFRCFSSAAEAVAALSTAGR